MANTLYVSWENEDDLEINITDGMFNMSIVDGVRLYPYIMIDNQKYYLEN